MGMKSFSLTIFIFLLLFSCEGPKKPDSLGGGIYTSQSQNEYSKVMDTLIISPYETPGTFLIIKRTGFQRIKEGQLLPKEYKVQPLVSVWNQDLHGLQELKRGRVYNFSSTGDIIVAGSDTYKKISN